MSVDRLSVVSLMIIILLGIVFNYAASPSIAYRLKVNTFFFVNRHLLMIPIGLCIVFLLSFLSIKNIKKFSVSLYFVCIVLLIFTAFIGTEIKGARRWLMIFGFSIQPSEFLKPALAIIGAWILFEKNENPNFPGVKIAFCLIGVSVFFLLRQPDLGMSLLIFATFGLQLFISGINIFWILSLVGVGGVGGIGAYFFLPHVTRRVNQFFNPTKESGQDELYQVQKSLEAFQSGGWFGRGPGEGVFKKNIPDAHADFIFSVVGEEFGFVVCSIVIMFFILIIMRSLLNACKQDNLFGSLSIVGIASQLGFQVFINIASALHLIPTKGMTLPFISYGGSSLLATSVSVGLLLSFTKRKTLIM